MAQKSRRSVGCLLLVGGLSWSCGRSSDGSVVVFDSLAFDLVGTNNGLINCYLAERGPSLRIVDERLGRRRLTAATNIVVVASNGSSDVFVTSAP